jgi:hypothetical protein
MAAATAAVAHQERESDSGIWRTDGPRTYPHAGASLQWPIGSQADFRLDTQLVFQFGTLIPMVPRAVGTLVWHPARLRSHRRMAGGPR